MVSQDLFKAIIEKIYLENTKSRKNVKCTNLFNNTDFFFVFF